MTQGEFYDIKLEYKEEQGSARVKLYWSSLSIPKAIIPSTSLYYPRYVGSSPYQVTVSTGPSVASKSTASGAGLTTGIAGKLAQLEIVSRDFASAPIDNQNDNYAITLVNKDGSGNGDLSFTAVYSGPTGKYSASYVPMKASVYTMSITLLGESISGSPFTVVVSTGDISATSTTTVSTPINIDAGSTYFFSIVAKDLYSSLITTGGESTLISIMAYFQNANSYTSPISVADLTNWQQIYGTDIAGAVEDLGTGTYIGQVTIFKAGVFTLDVKINSIQVTGSPFSTLTVSPVEVYAPNSVPTGVPTTAVAGVASTFKVQGRDFYSNNAQTLISTISATSVQLKYTSSSSVMDGTITDDATGAGAYIVSITPTLSGNGLLFVTIQGLNISQSPFSISVEPAATTDPTKTTITDFSLSYKAGDLIKFNIEARDAYSNLRPASTSETFVVTLTDADSVVTTITPASNGDGTYSCVQQFSKVSTYTLTVTDSAGSNQIASSPYTGIIVTPGLTQAIKSSFVSPSNPIVAGATVTYKVQAKDYFSNNVVEDSTNPLFFLSVYSPLKNLISYYVMTFQYGYFQADYMNTVAESKSMVIGVTRNGGLRATYYKTVSFYNAIEAFSTYYHVGQSPQSYTQIDPTIDIDSGYLSAVPGLPSKYFSVVWEGQLQVPATGTYRFRVDAVNFATISLTLDSQTLISLDAATSSVVYGSGEYYADVELTQGTAYDLRLSYSTKDGATQLRLLWESAQIAQQVVPAQYLYYTLYSETTPMTLVVQPSTTSPTNITVQGDYSKAVAGVSESITISAYDLYGNLQIDQADVFKIAFSLNGVTTADAAVVTAQSNGVYTATYTLTTTGAYSMSIQVQPGGAGSFVDIDGSPFAISCSDTTTDPQKTVLAGTGLTAAVAGVQSTFTATLYDTQANARTTGGDTVTATLYSGATSTGSTWVTDNADGTYRVQYQADAAGTYTITVVVNGDTANAKTSAVTLVAADPDPQQSTLTFASGVTIGTASALSIVAKDQFGNLVTAQQVEIAYELIGNHGLVSGNVPVTTLSSALYGASIAIPVPASTTVSE